MSQTALLLFDGDEESEMGMLPKSLFGEQDSLYKILVME